MIIGKRNFDLENKCYVMGILNVTPDSFSDGGKFNQIDSAIEHARQMIEEGADIIDVGGESTRPGYITVSDQEEIERVAPVIEAIKKNFDVPVSIDTYKGDVAKAALEAGADLLNDIWGFKADERMAVLAKEYDVPCCLMHNRKDMSYNSFKEDYLNDMKESIEIAKKAGVGDDKIILDPGVGFAKDYEMNLWVIKHLEHLKELGYPVLLGTSRKSVIGNALDLPVTERVEGTLATSVIGVSKGCAFVRVHDIKENVRAIKMAEAILQCNMEE